jgi:hypothetical protein
MSGKMCGGQGRNRTADASLFRAALYRLSYLAAGRRNSQFTKPLSDKHRRQSPSGFLVYSPKSGPLCLEKKD